MGPSLIRWVHRGEETVASLYGLGLIAAPTTVTHPKTTKKDWKKGDFMGAIVVRLK